MGGSSVDLQDDLGKSPVSFGKYVPFARLDRGGMAEIYLAVSRGPMGFNKLVVLKRLRAQHAEHASMVSMFLDEARLAARLSHPNIVHTYEVGEIEGAFFIAMEYLDGQPLSRVLRAPEIREVATPAMWCRLVIQALSGLHYAHELQDYDGSPLNIVHRDISPQNLIVTYSGEVKIVDFGIAKAVLNVTETETGVLKGKVCYMAPEQIYGKADPRSDVFAMGATLWELLTGKKLFAGDAVNVLTRVLNEPIPRLGEVCPNLDPALEAIVMTALDKDCENRFQSAEAMREALDGYIRGTGHVVRDAAMGQLVTTRFGEVRARVRRQIETHMQTASTARTPSDISGLSFSGSHPVLPRLNTSDTPANLHADESRTSGIVTQGLESGRPMRRAAAIGGGAVIVLAIAGLAALRSSGPAEATASAARAASDAPATRCAITLDSTPSGAAVELDGQAVGQTPLVVQAAVGARHFVLRKDGFLDETVMVDVPSSATTSLSRAVALRPVDVAPATASAPPSTAPQATAVAARPPALVRHAAPASPPKGHAGTGTGAAQPPASPAPTTPPAPTFKVKVLDDDDPKKSVTVIPE